ncbi:hypothetical protein TGAMA5MH_09989 [Trichoderma gamsii]|uniref:Uncharacterized protein n=1 Tax=Trichoderma gamsii TaxID=398673 RepID=A0A2K0SXX1_9HYPO|nr:hypothetical protein TGAMA5MH_09989 [Trichoderma gamsii]
MQPQGECRINIVTGQNMQPANRQIQAFAGFCFYAATAHGKDLFFV